MRLSFFLMLLVMGMSAFAAAQSPPREFAEFRGTWILDESKGSGQISGLGVARKIVIETAPLQIVVTKDAESPEVYRFDGSETQAKDLKTGTPLNRSYRFTLVSETLALTTKVRRGENSTIITDAYSVAGGVLRVERQLSVLVENPGYLSTLSDPANNRQTIVYRRSSGTP